MKSIANQIEPFIFASKNKSNQKQKHRTDRMKEISEKQYLELERQISDLQKRVSFIEDVCFAAKEILNMEEASKFLGISKSTFYKMTHQGTIPFYKPFGKLIFFEKATLLEWVRGAKSKSDEEVKAEAAAKLQELNQK